MTDDERRRVAYALRAIPKKSVPSDLDCRIAEALNGEGFCKEPECNMCFESSCNLFADLIEPSVDRDALLELADEIYESGRHYGEQIENAVTSDIIDDAPGEFRDYARRIREALRAD